MKEWTAQDLEDNSGEEYLYGVLDITEEKFEEFQEKTFENYESPAEIVEHYNISPALVESSIKETPTVSNSIALIMKKSGHHRLNTQEVVELMILVKDIEAKISRDFEDLIQGLGI